MSLYTSLYSGVSGLTGSSLELAIVGDNISNANTIGFKGSRAAFEDTLAQSLIGTDSAVGLGTRLQAAQRIITQGALVNTGLSTDLAIQGRGHFVVRGNANGTDGTYYSRAGQFTLNEDGLLVNLEGLRVQGYGVDPSGEINGVLGDLRLGGITAPPNATSEIVLKANLQADAEIPAAWDPTNPAATSNFSTSVTVYDSLGNDHEVNVYFSRTGAGAWEWRAMTDGGNVTGGTAGVPAEIANGTLTFDTDGRLVDQTQASNFNPIDSTNPQAIAFDFGDPIAAGGTGRAGMTQFSDPSATFFLSQDGFAAGDLAGVSFDENGRVFGSFTNGQTVLLGRLALANFSAPDELARIGGNLYNAAQGTGDPNIGGASEGGRGAIVAGALEQSNVDLATEFVRMIAAQRNFQANSKTINTADQLLGELIQLKR